ncbi:MAG: ABC transporter substrate-binding protein [Terricaulis sp.]|nr:ABC transporter substrate-binding protein [Terricaulis sp.]
MLGALIGREAQAEAYNSFRVEKLERIAARVATIPEAERPTVFLEAHAGNTPDCCNSPGRGNVGDYIAFVGGRNIGADVLDAAFGKLNLEYVIARDPDIYIATGGPHLERAGGFIVGPQYSAEQSRAALQRVASRRGIASLTAVMAGRTFGLSHQLLNSRSTSSPPRRWRAGFIQNCSPISIRARHWMRSTRASWPCLIAANTGPR